MNFPIRGDEQGRSFIAIRREDVAPPPPFKHCPVCGPFVIHSRPCGHLLVDPEYRIEWNFKPNHSGGTWRVGVWTVHTTLGKVSDSDAAKAFAEFLGHWLAEFHDCFRLVIVVTYGIQ